MRSLTVLLCLGLAAPAVAGQVRNLSRIDLCKRADRVVVGGVTKLSSRWQGQEIVTDVTVVPSENLKGTGTSPFVVTIPGGTVGNVTLRVSEAPRFAVGETVLLFVKPNNGPCGVYGWFKGKYSVVNGRIRELANTTFAQFRQQLLDIIEKL